MSSIASVQLGARIVDVIACANVLPMVKRVQMATLTIPACRKIPVEVHV
jgi:hypothetical protein